MQRTFLRRNRSRSLKIIKQTLIEVALISLLRMWPREQSPTHDLSQALARSSQMAIGRSMLVIIVRVTTATRFQPRHLPPGTRMTLQSTNHWSSIQSKIMAAVHWLASRPSLKRRERKHQVKRVHIRSVVPKRLHLKFTRQRAIARAIIRRQAQRASLSVAMASHHTMVTTEQTMLVRKEEAPSLHNLRSFSVALSQLIITHQSSEVHLLTISQPSSSKVLIMAIQDRAQFNAIGKSPLVIMQWTQALSIICHRIDSSRVSLMPVEIRQVFSHNSLKRRFSTRVLMAQPQINDTKVKLHQTRTKESNRLPA